MGYYADAEGHVTFKEEPSAEIRKFLGSDYDESSKTLYIGEYEKYYEEDYYELFEKTHGIVESGEIEFRGDDGALWRFIYIPEKGAWDEQSGRIVYNE